MNGARKTWRELREMRIALKITLKEAAGMIGVQYQTLSRWERGTRVGDPALHRKYQWMLQLCKMGRKKYKPSLQVKRQSQNMECDRVSVQEMEELCRRIKKQKYSAGLVAHSAGYEEQTVRRWLREKYTIMREQYTDIINALYDLETGGIYTSLTDSERQRAIRTLKLYKVNRRKLDDLRFELHAEEERGSVHAQSYTELPASAGEHSDPVAGHYARLERLRNAILRYEGKTSPVSEVWTHLKNSHNEKDRERCLVLERHYFGGAGLTAISEETGKAERTLYRRKCEVICLIASGLKENGEKSGEM